MNDIQIIDIKRNEHIITKLISFGVYDDDTDDSAREIQFNKMFGDLEVAICLSPVDGNTRIAFWLKAEPTRFIFKLAFYLLAKKSAFRSKKHYSAWGELVEIHA